VAAVTSPEGRESAPSERFRWLRELGSHALPAWAVLEASSGPSISAVPRAGAGTRLVVVQRAMRARFDDAELADWVRAARRVATLQHPNVARIRDAVIRKDDVLVVGDYVDGVRWSELAARGTPLAVALRVFVDILSGLGAIHALRDAAKQPLKLVHGALSPDAVIVGADGSARIVDCVRPAGALRGRSSEGSAYRAPEVLLGDATADQRADVYSAGVMLWEALSGARLFDGAQPSTIVTTLLSGRVPRATTPRDAPWAAALEGTIARALSAEPDKRFPSASEMAAEIRRIVGSRLGAAARVASWIDESFGEAIRRRRRELEGTPAGAHAGVAVDLVDAAIEIDEFEVASAPVLAAAVAPRAPAPSMPVAAVAPRAPAPSMPVAPPPFAAPVLASAAASSAITPEPIPAPSFGSPTSSPSAPPARRRRLVALIAAGLVVCLVSWAALRPSRSEAHARRDPAPLDRAPGAAELPAPPADVAPPSAEAPAARTAPATDIAAADTASATDAPASGPSPANEAPASNEPPAPPSPARAAPPRPRAPRKHSYEPQGI
jgi:serine/threonine-protein kinase